MSKLNSILEEKVTPMLGKFSQNAGIVSITNGMLGTMPLTLGTALIAVAVNFPVPAWTNWLAATGLDVQAKAIITGSSELTGLFLAFLIAYNYSKLKGADAMTGGILALGTFLMLAPQKIKLPDGSFVDGFSKSYLGSNGIFVAMIIGLLIASLYSSLNKKGLVIKLPDSVPEMVTRSLSPTFIAMIIFAIVFVIRVLVSYTSFGNVFDMVNILIGKPVMNFGSSPWALVAVMTLVNLIWFFGIHPNSILGVYIPVLMSATMGNIAAFQAGEAMPYFLFAVISLVVNIGGAGNTLALAIDMVLFSKSKRYKTLSKLAIIPNLFNINEPMIFGTPIIFNPVYFVPMVTTPLANALVGLLFFKLGAFNSLNPVVQLPWTTPLPIVGLITAGIMAAVAICCAIAISALIYFPFFKYADNKAYKEEQGSAE